MGSLSNHSKSRTLTIVLILFSSLLVASLFKNISYPLFWADESMTVMGGARVLEFGYPKVHDGKNVFYDLRHPNPRLGIDEKTDAYIGGANWGQYYFAALGIKLAEMSDDLFTKTGLIRSTFALIGLVGLAIFALAGRNFFHSELSRKGFLALFVFIELISVPLVLHLREARYYPLTIFLTALAIFIYAQYRLLNRIRYSTCLILLIVVLFLLFFTFSPAYFIFFISVLIFESALLAGQLVSGYNKGVQVTPAPVFRRKLFRDYLRNLLPAVISLITIVPFLVFFKTFHIAEEMAKYNVQLFRTDAFGMFQGNLSVIWRFFAETDLLYLAIMLKVCLIACVYLRSARNNLPVLDKPKIAFSGFLSIFFIVYFVFITRIPNFLFTRYFIPLQPVLALIIILDAAVVYDFLSQSPAPAMRRGGGVLAMIFAGFICFNIAQNFRYLEGHMYEMSHQYQGPLDYVIPYIRQNYPDPGHLVIATNYEETSFMYYLGSKVTVGFVGNNLEEDAKTVPDIIVYRKWHNIFLTIFTNFLDQYAYERISFPVADYPVNNLPELNWAPPVQHQFRTGETSDELKKVVIYVRK